MKIRSKCHRAYVEVMDTEDFHGTLVCQACRRACQPINSSRFKVIAGDTVLDKKSGQHVVINMVWPLLDKSWRHMSIGGGGFHDTCTTDPATGERVQCAVKLMFWSAKDYPVVKRAEE